MGAAGFGSRLLSGRDQVRGGGRKKWLQEGSGLNLRASMNVASCETERHVLDKGGWMHEVHVRTVVVVATAAAAAVVFVFVIVVVL